MPLQWVTETLSRSMVVQEQRNTTLVDIGVYHTKPELAAVIANTIAVTYRDKRIEELRKNTDQTLKEMKDELKTKEDEMARLFQEASKIRQDESISDPDPDSSNAALSITAPTGIATGETQLAETRALVDRLRSQLMRVEKLKPEELMEAARILGITDSTVEKTLPLLQDQNRSCASRSDRLRSWSDLSAPTASCSTCAHRASSAWLNRVKRDCASCMGTETDAVRSQK
jgi:uncharacterized protein involved in exopolysaccharide biosynthesis